MLFFHSVIRCTSVPKGGLGSKVPSAQCGKAAAPQNNTSFLSGGGAEAVFVFFVEIGCGQVAVGCVDKKGDGFRV